AQSLRYFGRQRMRALRKETRLAAWQKLVEARNAFLHERRRVEPAVAEQGWMRHVRCDVEEAAFDSIECEAPVHGNETGTHDLIVIGECPAQGFLPAWKIVAVPIARLDVHRQAKRPVAGRQNASCSSNPRSRRPGASGGPW